MKTKRLRLVTDLVNACHKASAHLAAEHTHTHQLWKQGGKSRPSWKMAAVGGCQENPMKTDERVWDKVYQRM